MSPSENDTRTVLRLTTGSKICVLVALPILVAAAYFLWTPISLPSEGGRFSCGSAFNPPSEDFPQNVCGTVNQMYLARAAFLLAAGLLVAAVGTVFFGVDRTTEKRTIRDETDDED